MQVDLTTTSVNPTRANAMSVNPTRTNNENKIKRSGYWSRLKKKWRRKGVVEVDIDHHRYDVLECVRRGIRTVLEDHPELGPKHELEQEDYDHVLVKTLESSSGKKFEFASYGSSVFATLRQAIGLEEEDYKNSISPEELPYLEFISNSRSGLDFFLTNDKQYFMKSDRPNCISLLRQILRRYLEHFLKFPHSLIVKYLGLYSVKIPGKGQVFFYAMQSIFFPEERIEKRYDVKGCMAGRYQQPPKDDVVTVLKDQNFRDEEIKLGPQREWFLKQLEHDLNLMSELCVQDYSLLVGSHPLQSSEIQEKSDMANMVMRVQKSVLNVTGSPKSSGYSVEETSLQEDGRPSLTKRPFSLLNTDDLIESQNRRLLPKSRNALHIINGPDTRYYLGVIDFFTLYQCRQRVGRVLKSMKFCCGDHSTIPPAAYARRMLDFIREHTS